MTHDLVGRWRTWALEPGQAKLEVTIDPAAHGPDALGPLSRGVALRTSSGKELQFTLKAEVTH
jgi:hypothetical protein